MSSSGPDQQLQAEQNTILHLHRKRLFPSGAFFVLKKYIISSEFLSLILCLIFLIYIYTYFVI